ncbi:vps53-like domain protein [Angomonas deanei]|uniref:Vps53-like, N-terminal, putative n=1 Tax=Angomonas deanei TaxID=59799 RepID=A0A7G2CEZ7_9TRYP|nr:vps53-like domain protein [Angomonas deanei]CAD2217561.1 Vps53-like, N-terminal, putative [Angomonas deanei]|eukprot:EPY27239.1 vps53-like domain protein [Angomonas deanei]
MSVRYSDAVEKAIAEVCPPRDAFDAGDFDPVEYLNSRFPDENSLAALPAFLEETNKRLRQTESDLLKSVEKQAVNADVADSDLKNAKQSVAQLYTRVDEIKTKASQSEETVKDLCQHIRELDIAKTNLTASINTLRSIQLWMLQLQVLSSSFERRKYVQCRDALFEAKKYSKIFESFKDTPKVKELNDKQQQICRQIEYYIRNTVFADISLENLDENTMAEACSIIDLMEPESIKKIRDRFIEKALETYTLRFKRGTDDATLAKTERRYVFIRTLLENYDHVFKNVFPKHWCVPQELCVTFCIRTKQELDHQLQENEGNIEVVVLIYVLQKTIEIERDLTTSMAWKEEFASKHELPVYKYNGMILSAFRDHMGLFVKNEDKLMSDALAQPLIGEGDAACHGWNGEDDVRVGTALPLAEDIFVFIRESLKRALRIAQQDVLLDMAGVWRRNLIQFSKAVATLLPKPAVSALDVRRVCILINTAELCQTTSQDLGDEVCARSEAPQKEVAFNEVVDAFSVLFSQCIQAIVIGTERNMAPLMYEYGNGAYIKTKKEADGGAQDESRLIRSMATVLHDLVVNCAAILPTTSLRFLLNKVAAAIIPHYINTLYKQRRMTDDAVSAMRVDSSALEKRSSIFPTTMTRSGFSRPPCLPTSSWYDGSLTNSTAR